MTDKIGQSARMSGGGIWSPSRSKLSRALMGVTEDHADITDESLRRKCPSRRSGVRRTCNRVDLTRVTVLHGRPPGTHETHINLSEEVKQNDVSD